MEFRRPTRIGSTLLTAGRYQFQHHWIEGRHYLVIQSHGTPTHAKGSHEAGTDGEVARVACRIVRATLRAATELWLTEGVDGISTLARIGLLDERRAHVPLLQPLVITAVRVNSRRLPPVSGMAAPRSVLHDLPPLGAAFQ